MTDIFPAGSGRYPADAPASEALFDRARAIVPGGVNSPVRAFRAVGGTPRFMVRGEGPWLYDADGRRYVDLVCSWGPLILGHAHPEVVGRGPGRRRARHQLRHPHAGRGGAGRGDRRAGPRSSRSAWSTPAPRRPCRAIRLARGFTGRSKIVKFAGCYHGHVDALLAAAGSGVATLGPARLARRDRRGGQRDDRAAVQRHRPPSRRPSPPTAPHIAAVITEAAAGNMGVVAPRDGFNQQLARIAHAHGALLIVDEVMTGFRVSRAGWHGLDAVRRRPVDVRQGHGWRPARRGVRRPRGRSWRGSPRPARSTRPAPSPVTRWPAPPAWPRCGSPTTRVYQRARRDGRRRGQAGLRRAGRRRGPAPAVVRGQHVLDLLHRRRRRRLRQRAHPARRRRSRRSSTRCSPRGVYLPPSAFESWFVSAAIDDAALEHIADALPTAANAAAAAGHGGVDDLEQDGRCTCCGTARCTTPTRSSTAGCPASASPSWACRWPRPPRRRLAERDDHARGGQPAGARPADRRADRRPVRAAGRGGRAADRERQLVRGQEGLRRRRVVARPAQLVGAARPGDPVLGRGVPGDRRADVRRRARRPGRRRGARGGAACRTSCRSGRCAGTSSASGSGTTRASGSAGWPASPRSTSTARRWSGIGYSEPAAHLIALSATARTAKGA